MKNGYANASICSVTRTLSVLLVGAAVCQDKRVTDVCKKDKDMPLQTKYKIYKYQSKHSKNYCTRFGTLIVATIYLQLIQNRYMFRSFTVLQCSHRHCVQPVASDVEVVGYLYSACCVDSSNGAISGTVLKRVTRA